MEEKRWFGQTSVGQLIAIQRPNVTPVVRTMAAAYTQRAMVSFLLSVIDGHKVKLTPVEKEKVEKIKVQHAKHLIAGGE